MAFAMLPPRPTLSFGRGGYNKDGDDEEDNKFCNHGRGGYNKSNKDDEDERRGSDDDDEAEEGRGGYN
ncbi:MAG: hypothetical protein M1818_005911 [Claussenomyces sp. TS43310]|nr:MAG: hypothetical protein M1818_005911 [Claussenomyces sp. TS43310]